MIAAHVVAAAFAGNFQAAWYLTIICLFGFAIVAWGVFQVARTLPAMWRQGDVLLLAAMVSLVCLVVLFFTSLILMTLISLGPPVGR